VAGGMEVGDSLLLGTDLVKDVDRLEAAYNDRAGVTAEFNRNVLRVLNHRLDADFDLDCFQHVAFFDLDQEWIEMRLRARKTHEVVIPGCGDLRVAFEAGEEMRTEISAKFRRATVEAELAQVGLELVEWWTDAAGDFALSLSIAR
jgi:L-histidine N-alpha-methyltransferase